MCSCVTWREVHFLTLFASGHVLNQPAYWRWIWTEKTWPFVSFFLFSKNKINRRVYVGTLLRASERSNGVVAGRRRRHCFWGKGMIINRAPAAGNKSERINGRKTPFCIALARNTRAVCAGIFAVFKQRSRKRLA